MQGPQLIFSLSRKITLTTGGFAINCPPESKETRFQRGFLDRLYFIRPSLSPYISHGVSSLESEILSTSASPRLNSHKY